MKILMINSHFSSGGPPKIMNGIVEELLANKIDVKIASARGTISYPGISFKFCYKIEVLLNGLKARLFDNEGLNSRIPTRRWVLMMSAKIIMMLNG